VHPIPSHLIDRAITQPPRGRPTRLLLVEDDHEVRLLIAGFLRDLPCLIEYSSDGLSAVEKFIAGTYDLVLMDVWMPFLDGLEATRRIRQFERDEGRRPTPVVALTGNALDEDVAREAGYTEQLEKPLARRRLIELVTSLTTPAPSEPTVAGLDEDIVALRPAYVRRRRADLELVRAALAGVDFGTLETLGHRMKGSGSAYGFDRISEIGRSLEDAAHDGDLEGVRRCETELARWLDEEPAGAQ
jgi:CheY-like chemotaxis protein